MGGRQYYLQCQRKYTTSFLFSSSLFFCLSCLFSSFKETKKESTPSQCVTCTSPRTPGESAPRYCDRRKTVLPKVDSSWEPLFFFFRRPLCADAFPARMVWRQEYGRLIRSVATLQDTTNWTQVSSVKWTLYKGERSDGEEQRKKQRGRDRGECATGHTSRERNNRTKETWSKTKKNRIWKHH